MKTRFLLTAFFLFLMTNGSIFFAQNNKKTMNSTDNFSTLWEKVEKEEKSSLPQSAAQIVEKIYQKALSEKNSPELLKSLIHKMKFELVIDQSKAPELITELEKYTNQNSDKVEQSVLYSMLAQLYVQYYQSDSYTINKRTAIIGYVPEDIREWTGNIFIQKIIDYINRSLEAKDALQATDVMKYEAILTKGESSRSLRPTLYDFIVYQGINLLSSGFTNAGQFFEQSKFSNPAYFSSSENFIQLQLTAEQYDIAPKALKLYQQLLSFRLKNNNAEALLQADLDRIEFVYNNTENDDRGANYLNALTALEKQYEKSNFCVEILYKKALYYQQSEERPVLLLKNGKQNNNTGKEKAYQTCVDGIKKYPNYDRINLLINLRNQLTSSHANIQSDRVVYPGKSIDLKISYQNMDYLTIEIYKISAPVTVYEDYWNMQGQYEKSGTLVEKRTIQLLNNYPYIQSDTTISIPMKALGCYEYVISGKGKEVIVNQQFSVTRLSSVSRAYDSMYEFLVVDRISGKPIEGAKVNLYEKQKNKNILVTTITTGKNGLVSKSYEKMDNIAGYNVTIGDDNALILSSAPWNSGYGNQRDNFSKLDLFTDRSIYRPGQTVFLKGIAYKLGQDTSQIIPNQNYTLSLKDPNGKVITSKIFKTSEMGSFSGEFVLPQNLLNGYFTLGTEDYSQSTSFRVEEYKRPSFDINFLPVKETYHFGDQVTVKGESKTFSGVNIQNTKVKYRIIQRVNRLFGWWEYQTDNQIAEGFVETNSNGQFEISFISEKRFNEQKLERISYTYEIQASITDTKGETQESKTFISVGDISMLLQVNGLEGNLNKDSLPEVKIQAFNLNNEPIKCQGSYEIYNLKAEQSLRKTLENSDWQREKLIDSGSFVAGEKITVQSLQKALSGKYRIVMKANDDQGREVLNESDFLLFSINDKQPPIMTYEWVLTPKTTCKVGENAEIIYGSSAKEVYVLYELFKDNKKLETNRFELNNNLKKLEIPFKESYGEGVVINLTFIKDGQLFSQNIPIYKKKTNKALTINTEVFRDKLLPGQKEEWKISVHDADKKTIEAEVLAGMYDVSLDKIYAHNWNFYPIYTVSLSSPNFLEGNEFRTVLDQLYVSMDYRDVPQFSFDSFNWFGMDFYHPMMLRSELSEVVVKGYGVKRKVDTVGAVSEVALAKAPAPPSALDASAENKIRTDEAEQPVQIRKNLNETAFFYPTLKTNSAGETLISFTVPESNTTWKFMALAHTQDLKYGLLIKEAVSQKKLMVSPNMPRFIRHGDKMALTTEISNLTDSLLTGKVSILFFDPATEKQTIVVPQSEQNFSVEGGKTTSASWSFQVPSGIDITACKIVAQSTNFSDGEQHLLPVLPNRMMVTESLPINISGKGNKNFSFDKLVKNQSKTIENYRLTLEFASNPAWYAVQALPAMTTPTNENVLSWFAAYYANTLATSIANGMPKIRQIIDTWSKQGGTQETLISNLEKNQELKAVLLEETPWVMEASNESEQKQRLNLLFDINRNDNLSASTIAKLKELQLQDGGWAWFKGMYSSVSITQWILYGMGELKELCAVNFPDDIQAMQSNAVQFIDKEFNQNFEDLKKYNSNWKEKNTLSTYELEYLLVRSFYNEYPVTVSKKAIDFYSDIAEKYWTKIPNLYDRAIIAMIMQQAGKKEVVNAIIKSLREHASHSEELGMYWANNNTRAFMFQSATAVHTFIMEAFEKAGSTSKEMDEMKLWLLKQKQTQQWESTPATVNAISILLRTGGNWLESEGQTDITLGKEKVVVDKKEAGTGYFKKVYEPAVIKSGMGNVSLSKTDDGPAWGTLFWQYYEQLDNITQSKTNLNVEKALFVEKVSGSGKTLVPVTETSPLEIGDKVTIRLTVRNDRDMEYVMLKDMRASCFEPVEQLSGTKWREKVVYYQTTKDASTNFYFYNLPKGTYVFEYPVYVTRQGEYSNGITTIQCMYAPEFVSNTEGKMIKVGGK